MNWRDISYLRCGNAKQRRLFDVLSTSDILTRLKNFDPAVVSTICIDIDSEASDVDIICEITDKHDFQCTIDSFASFEKFRVLASASSPTAVVAEFAKNGFIFEVYGDFQAVTLQNAYRHLSTMARPLDRGGEKLRSDVRRLKEEGIKSELAFCRALSITGDPYSALLQLESASDEEIQKIIASANYF